jgi:hypothetical protein
MMGFGLLLQLFKEIFNELLGTQLGKFIRVHIQGPGDSFGVAQPLFQEHSGGFIEVNPFRVGKFNPLELVRKDLIVKVKIPLTLNQDGPGTGIKIFQGTDQAKAEGLLQAKERSRSCGNSYVTKFIEEVDEQDSLEK